jgi:hypothetical protein
MSDNEEFDPALFLIGALAIVILIGCLCAFA